MSKNDNGVPSIYERIPAVAALNKAPGFDPVKLLRRTVSQKTREPVMKLDLPYKKLWFRLLYPNGRIKLKALRVTEQMAIFEAQIYLDRMDPEPISSFTASCSREDSPGGRYVEDAQEAAADEALSTAGFGLQFADISMTSLHRRFGSEIPLGDVVIPENAAMPAPAAAPVKPAQKAEPAPGVRKASGTAVQMPANKTPAGGQAAVRKPAMQSVNAASPVRKTPAVNQPASPVQKRNAPAARPVQENAVHTASQPPVFAPESNAVSTAPKQMHVGEPAIMEPANKMPAPEQKGTHTQKALEILQGIGTSEVAGSAEAAPVIQHENSVDAAPSVSYDASTPVEQIMSVMTLEEARNTKVETGIFAGKTLGEIADSNKGPNIRFYVYGGYKGKNNIFLAAAKIVYQALEQKAA